MAIPCGMDPKREAAARMPELIDMCYRRGPKTPAVKIESGIPLPPPPNWRHVLASMKAGDSFICAPEEYKYLLNRRKEFGVKLTGRKQPDGSFRIWRLE